MRTPTKEARLAPLREGAGSSHWLMEGTPGTPRTDGNGRYGLKACANSHKPRADKLEPAVWGFVSNLLKTPDLLREGLERLNYFVGGRYSVADIALYAYTHVADEGASTSAGTRPFWPGWNASPRSRGTYR